jgi:hypothetical protein
MDVAGRIGDHVDQRRAPGRVRGVAVGRPPAIASRGRDVGQPDRVECCHDRREQGTHPHFVDGLQHVSEATFRDGVEACRRLADLDDRWDRERR